MLMDDIIILFMLILFPKSDQPISLVIVLKIPPPYIIKLIKLEFIY